MHAKKCQDQEIPGPRGKRGPSGPKGCRGATCYTGPDGPTILPANSINSTVGGDVDLFNDGVVRLWLDDSTTDDIELEITNVPPLSSSLVYHVSWTNFQSPCGTPSSQTLMSDLNASSATSSLTLDSNFTTDEYMTILCSVRKSF